jgi:hypothetical protein
MTAAQGSGLMEKSTVPYALVVDDDALILMDACDIVNGGAKVGHSAA